VSPSSYFFMSNSNGQGEEWLKTLNKVVWLPFTVYWAGVFGQRLEDTVQYERRYGDRTAPLIVEQCVSFIQSHGLLEVGLFRQPGQATLVKELQDAFDAGEKPSFDSSTDVHTVASLLKLYLRELPEPVVPFSKYDDFLLCAKLLSGGRQQGLVQLKKLLQELPNANFNLLHYICGFLNEVQSYCHINKMSTQNLATVFGPNLLRPKAEDPETIIGGTALVQQLMSVLISEHSKLFLSEAEADGKDCLLEAHCGDCGEKPREVENTGLHSYSLSPASESDNLPRETQLVPRACVRQLSLPLIAARRGLSKNPTQADRSASSQSHIISRPRCQSEMEIQASEESSPGSSSDPLYDNYCSGLACQVRFECHSREEETTNETQATSSPSPCHCTRTTQGGSFSTPVNPHNSLEEDSRKTQSCAGEKHRSSLVEGEKNKTYESMLSVYDNIESGALLPKPQEMTSIDSTSWSSCEIVLVHTPERNRVSYYRADPEELPASSSFRGSSALSGNPRSSSSSEVFFAPQEACSPSSPMTMHNLLSGLKQQMAKQKEEYEAQIRSLEQRNEELEKEVRDLHSNLEQQRRWYSVVEIKMRNVERARADAERRNSMLQREMEVFFDTFGELTKEAKKTERIVQSF
uniref:Si:ch211-247j9.1 n=1 Tax=Lepisosteus oculatus TaxID=7918 RepID=W5MV98_LEPOC